jgi:UDP-2,3-diacylglucosamine pyrophosphatase LpxH
LLAGVCGALLQFWNDLPAGVSLKAVQLGDFLDLWREDRVEHDDVTAMVQRILDDNAVARSHLARFTPGDPATLQADLLVGNHDLDTNNSVQLRRAARAKWYGMDGVQSLLVTHGDLFDGLEEGLKDAVQAWFVRNFAEGVGGGVYRADRTRGVAAGSPTGPQGQAPIVIGTPNTDAETAAATILPEWVNAWVTRRGMSDLQLESAHELLPRALRWAKRWRRGDEAALRRIDRDAPLDQLRTIVVGHSHHPRICVHRDPLDATQDLCLFDCGGWIEEMHFGPDKDDDRVPSCTIGVLTGGDARIYQLDPADRLFAASRDGGG